MVVLKVPTVGHSVGHSVTNGRPTSQDLASLRAVFATVHAESCPYQYNFHMHTNHSDGQMRPDTLVQQALDLGLKGFAITDHHQIAGFDAAQAYLADWQTQSENQAQPLPHLWTGVEITASLLNVEVHILGFAFNPHHGAIATYLTGEAPKGESAEADRVISAIHQAGGLAVLAHPVRYRKSIDELIPAVVSAGIDGVETFYAYSNPKPWRPTPEETEEVMQYSQHYRLLNTCGTDSHGLSLEHRL
jgi:predicted metal-dependent phosphoesterase TrpH